MFMSENPIKQRIARGEPCRGGWLSIPSLYSARLLSRLPFDWLTVDTEHSPVDPNTLAQMVAVIADSQGPVPFVRLSQASVENIKRALDSGASGVIAPMINSRAEAEQVITWAKYPPLGQRSFGSFYAPMAFHQSMSEYLHNANEQTMAIIQIESKDALGNLDAIFSTPGLDLAFIGPVDLSVSLGLEPIPENTHPLFLEAIKEIQRAALAHKLPLGIFCSNGKAASERIKQGFLFVNAASDTRILLNGGRAELEASRE
jgi:2-keto-3-deoxy-L-rhamnonate aldolase RhmA